MNHYDKALDLMRRATGLDGAVFHPGQWEAIEALLARKRMLVVERTGWGKSMVYFVATKLLREQGCGVTLLISPLLSLMRNQLEASQRLGLKSDTINCTNRDEWASVERNLLVDTLDLLLVSPERLANDEFQQNVLNYVAPRVGLFVVDEAHCISDWGHDFRPDYRRIVNVLAKLPPNIPVLATTATANDRVVADVKRQLGNINHVKGTLGRDSLRLQNIVMPSPSARLAWLAEHIPRMDGSGIVYTLTVRDAKVVAEWLQINGIKAEAYYADLDKPGENGESKKAREALEQRLLNNDLKVLVATVALGMGFDKPDLAFVIHYQRPSSVVHYYQQVGRAGRAITSAYGILLGGEEDDQIADYFISHAFPPQAIARNVLDALLEQGLSVNGLMASLNYNKGLLEKTLKFLSVENPSPIVKIKHEYKATQTAATYQIDQVYVDKITQIRKAEQLQMREYMMHAGCLMEYLSNALDDPHTKRCGHCANCLGRDIVGTHYDHDLANRAALFLRRAHQPIPPRKLWPSGAFTVYCFTGRISPALQMEEGRALSLWRDAGWGTCVAEGKYEDHRFSDELVAACVDMINEWKPQPSPEWITCIPSLRRPALVPDFARRLAMALQLPFFDALSKVKQTPQQKEMNNSFHQANNLDGAFSVDRSLCLARPCILVDDMVDSRWTFTVSAALLRQSGCPAVFPLALALNSPRMD